MKKFIVTIILLLLLANIAIHVFRSEERTPCSILKERMDIAFMNVFCSPTYGFAIKYPDFFKKEEAETSNGDSCNDRIRFHFDDNANIIIESYVMPAPCKSARDCALTLADSMHAKVKMPAQGKSNRGNICGNGFILEGPLYENGVPADGYGHYTKYVKSGRMLFVYSLIFPEDYKQALQRMFRIIGNWTVPGAC